MESARIERTIAQALADVGLISDLSDGHREVSKHAVSCASPTEHVLERTDAEVCSQLNQADDEGTTLDDFSRVLRWIEWRTGPIDQLILRAASMVAEEDFALNWLNITELPATDLLNIAHEMNVTKKNLGRTDKGKGIADAQEEEVESELDPTAEAQFQEELRLATVLSLGQQVEMTRGPGETSSVAKDSIDQPIAIAAIPVSQVADSALVPHANASRDAFDTSEAQGVAQSSDPLLPPHESTPSTHEDEAQTVREGEIPLLQLPGFPIDMEMPSPFLLPTDDAATFAARMADRESAEETDVAIEGGNREAPIDPSSPKPPVDDQVPSTGSRGEAEGEVPLDGNREASNTEVPSLADPIQSVAEAEKMAQLERILAVVRNHAMPVAGTSTSQARHEELLEQTVWAEDAAQKAADDAAVARSEAERTRDELADLRAEFRAYQTSSELRQDIMKAMLDDLSNQVPAQLESLFEGLTTLLSRGDAANKGEISQRGGARGKKRAASSEPAGPPTKITKTISQQMEEVKKAEAARSLSGALFVDINVDGAEGADESEVGPREEVREVESTGISDPVQAETEEPREVVREMDIPAADANVSIQEAADEQGTVVRDPVQSAENVVQMRMESARVERTIAQALADVGLISDLSDGHREISEQAVTRASPRQPVSARSVRTDAEACSQLNQIADDVPTVDDFSRVLRWIEWRTGPIEQLITRVASMVAEETFALNWLNLTSIPANELTDLAHEMNVTRRNLGRSDKGKGIADDAREEEAESEMNSAAEAQFREEIRLATTLSLGHQVEVTRGPGETSGIAKDSAENPIATAAIPLSQVEDSALGSQGDASRDEFETS
ncbi:uncharacterized protein LOC116016036 [Ipomoea triloba]|uniref:uncharacterized protein LOC116016036 n=1 Tax=Ipomoea triloba TaxID=35885 RepID=UPI00125E3F27|nr:uncharacterized protein LOC116016036 [Ipomoea triloba]